MKKFLPACFCLIGITTANAAPDWENEAVFRRNKAEPHVIKMPFSSAREALSQKRMESEWCQLLNGDWTYKWSSDPSKRPTDFFKLDFDDSSWGKIKVPSNVEIEGHGTPIYSNTTYPFKVDPPRVMGEPPRHYTNYENRNPVSSYRRTFEVPGTWNSRQTSITFNGVASAFYLWINGQKIGYSQDSRTPAEFDITEALKPGENLIAVEVYRHSDGSYLECQDFWRLSGIFRDVYLTSMPQVDLRDFEVFADFDPKSQSGELNVGLELINHSGEDKSAEVLVSLLDSSGAEVIDTTKLEVKNASPDAVTKLGVKKAVSRIAPWSAESPTLYDLVLTVKSAEGKTLAVYSEKVGFRHVEIDKGQLKVNGLPILIKGVNRHDHHHITGHYITEETMISEMNLMKRLNINAIRTSHYPNDPRFLELCDEYGFYVISEANIESHGMGYGENSLAKKPKWGPAHLDRVRNMVEAFRNHPSVIMWSMANEAGNGINFVNCSNWISENDPTRPVHYEGAGMSAHVDLFSPMYFRINSLDGWCRKEEKKPENERRPLIQCEFNHTMGNSSGGYRDYWDKIRQEPLLQGGFVWDWRDQGLAAKKKAPIPIDNEIAGGPKGLLSGVIDSNDGLISGHVSFSSSPEMTPAESLQIEALVNIEKLEGHQPIVVKGDKSYGLKISPGGNLQFFVYSNKWHEVNAPFPKELLGKWTKVGGAFDGEQLSISINGKKITRNAYDGVVAKTLAPLAIGLNADDTNRKVKGKIKMATVDVDESAIVKISALEDFADKVAEEVDFFAYGGDFNDAPNDGSFCLNGVVAADLSLNPHAHEISFQYRQTHLSLVKADSEKIVLSVMNERFFEKAKDQQFQWQLLEDGIVIAEGSVADPFPDPGESADLTIPLPPEFSAPKKGSEYHISVSTVLTKDRRWAKAGHVRATHQFLLPYAGREITSYETTATAPSYQISNNVCLIKGAKFSAEVSLTSGKLLSYKLDGKEQLAAPLQWDTWRVPTNNDLGGNNIMKRSGMWRGVGALSEVTNRSIKKTAKSLVVDLDCTLPVGKTTGSLSYRFFGDGAIEISATLSPKGKVGGLPRIGMRCELQGSELAAKWFGRGPYENYRDRNTSATVAVWADDVKNLWHPYAVPQETGNRTDVRWASFTGDETSLKIEAADNQLLEICAYPFKMQDLEGKRHPVDIPERDLTTVHISHGQMGVGGENSWGAPPLEKYRLLPNRTYQWKFRILPQ